MLFSILHCILQNSGCTANIKCWWTCEMCLVRMCWPNYKGLRQKIFSGLGTTDMSFADLWVWSGTFKNFVFNPYKDQVTWQLIKSFDFSFSCVLCYLVAHLLLSRQSPVHILYSESLSLSYMVMFLSTVEIHS